MSKPLINKDIVSSQQVRDAFVNYFKSKKHTAVPSASLVPANDPTLLFTNAGMVQFKDVFLGQEQRPYNRAVSVQRCVRAGGKHNDLENVGYTARHHTFFEMLGNFSFGDYFKQDAIFFAWEFLTQVLKLPEDKLWVTVYEDDDEAEKIWFDEIGIDQSRFSRLGKKDNFWSMGDTGPCGPCSEIFFDHGEDVAGGPPGSADEDGDRYIEIWNLVFMQFEKTADGKMTPLPNPSIDTGMGLERVAAIMQNVHSNYEIDIFQYLIKASAKAVNCNDLKQQSLQVIADHIRSCAFLLADGVIPSNEGRGYVLRRIIRRAVRHGFKLGGKPGFFSSLVEPLCQIMGEAYPELVKAKQRVEKSLLREEEQFAKTLSQGMELLEKELKQLNSDTIPGSLIFRLYDTYGFPVDLTGDIAREKGYQVDEAGFEVEMDAQRSRSREGSNFGVDYREAIRTGIETQFVGYDSLEVDTQLAEIIKNGEKVNSIEKDETGMLILPETTFYAESGGQVGDIGRIISSAGEFKVTETTKSGKAFLHHGHMVSGKFEPGDKVEAVVETENRRATALNHSATHLLHAALQNVLGDHVMQKGSMVSSERLRFDFAHPEPMTEQEKLTVERLVNQQIRANHAVVTEIMSAEDAKKAGAMALFGEKYGDEVRVLSMGSFSKELCGGTHVKNTGDIGLFKLINETGIASGVRRVEGLTGATAIDAMQADSRLLHAIAAQFKTTPEQINERIKLLTQQLKESQKSAQALQTKLALGTGSDPLADAVKVGDISVLCKTYDGLDAKALRDTMDKLRDRMAQGVVVLASVNNTKVQLIVGVSKALSEKIHAGKLVGYLAEQLGGRGGGRADMAQAGGSDAAALPRVMESAKDWVAEQL